ncbi:tenascin-like isoform X2 [Arapaima gigas]
MLLIPHVLLLALPFSALLTVTKAKELQEDVAQEIPASLLAKPLQGTNLRTLRDTSVPQTQQPFRILITDTCVQKDTQGDAGTPAHNQGMELDLEPGKPLVLTHRISLVPTSCAGGCESEFAALRERLERLEKEVTTLNEKCRATEGGCCNQQGSGAGCSKCPNECNDQGRCVDGNCICFPGFTGPDCSSLTCPSNCSKRGKCVKGQCVCHSGFSGHDCSEKNCPNNCRKRGRCVNGKCMCDLGFTGPDCSAKACLNNCSNKGRCLNGKCVCNSGFTGPDCSEKACPNHCRNRGQCVNGECVCNLGFTGPDCSEKACPSDCNNRGQCVKGKCVCDTGFTGPNCATKSCPNNCSKKGRCMNGKCMCEEGFMGQDCSEKACPSDCHDRGQCVNGECVCATGFKGPDCSEKACPSDCNDRGQCVNGECVCATGFKGPDCSEKACPSDCNDRGQCVNGKCVCNSGFTGPDCSEKACPNHCRNRGQCVNGECVCDTGFTGPDCSEKACPSDCNDRGQCVNGECVCDTGFKGPDCSEKACPSNCNDRGHCVNGECVCDTGFKGPDCSEKACPSDCNNRGQCVNGKCVCDTGFTGPDCATKSCPNNCSEKGRCVNGKCLCEEGFTGQDCSLKSCPANCNNKGSCVKGKCVCRVGFTGSDCSQCAAGFTGPHCNTVLSAVTQLRSRDITDSSVTIFWTQPSVQYDVYHITFTSKKEGDHTVTSTAEGSLSTYVQTGLAPGQEYIVTIRGEKDGVMGQENTIVFTTLISGPKDLRVVKTTTTTAVVRWEPPQGDFDRYHLSVSPSQTEGTVSGKGVMVLPPERESASIKGLEAGRLYNITLLAQKGKIWSQPITVHVTPGNVTMAGTKVVVSTRKAPKTDTTDRKPTGKKKPDMTTFYKKEDDKREKVGSTKKGYNNETQTDSSVTPGLKRPQVKDKRVLSKPGFKPILFRKPEITGLVWYNGTRTGLGGIKKEGQTLPKPRIKNPTERKILVTGSKLPRFGNKTLSLIQRQKMLGGGPGLWKKETYTRKKEDKTYQANRGHNCSSLKEESENRNILTKSSNVWENRTDTDQEPLEQHTMDGRNGSETQGKNCLKKTSGNKTMVDTAVGSSNSSSSEVDMNYRTDIEVVNIVGRTDSNETKALERNGTLMPGKRPVANLDAVPPKVDTAKQPSPTGHSATTQMTTGQSKDYHSQSPASSPNSFPQPYPPPAASFSEGDTMEDNQKLKGAKPKVIQPSDSVTSSIHAAFPYIQLHRVAPTLHPSASNIKTSPSEPTSTELDQGILNQNGDKKNEKQEDATFKTDKVATREKVSKMPTLHRQDPRNILLHPLHIRQFRNRTQTKPRPLYHPSRGILKRPLSPKMKSRENTFGGRIFRAQGWQGNYSKGQTNNSITETQRIVTQGSDITERATHGYMKTNLSGSLRATDLKPETTPSDHDDSNQNVTSSGTQASKASIYSKVNANRQSGKSTSATKQPSPGLSSVGVQNITSRGFLLTWDAPEGMFKNFFISGRESVIENRNGANEEREEREGDNEGNKKEERVEGDGGEATVKAGLSKAPGKEAGDPGTINRSKSKADGYRKGTSDSSTTDTTSILRPPHDPRVRAQARQKFLQFVPGTARSLQIQNLRPRTPYSVSLFGKGPGIKSKIHQLKIVTGPEPPSDLRFSNVTDSSFYVSWMKPKRPVTGFKVTLVHMKDGEPVSLLLNSQHSSVPLSTLSPGSSYEVSVISTQGADESDPLKGVIVTAPDPPTDLRVINVTDTSALLLWRPALAAVDQYIIVYGSEKGSDVTVTVSGNTAEQQLKGLRGSSLYKVTVTSQLGDQRSRGATTQFITTSGSVERLQGPRDLTATQVTPQSAMLTWKPPTSTPRSYRLTYQTAEQEMMEVTLDGSTTQHKLKRLRPKSKYTVRLQGEQHGQYSMAISTNFSTGTLRFPHPTDCSQQLMNGIQESGEVEIFPNGPQGQSALVFCDMETDGGGWTVRPLGGGLTHKLKD